MNSDQRFLTFDSNGLPDAIVDAALIRAEVNSLYSTLLSNMTAHGDDIVDIVTGAVTKAGTHAGGLLALNVVVKLLQGAVLPLSLRLQDEGVTTGEILGLIKPTQ